MEDPEATEFVDDGADLAALLRNVPAHPATIGNKALREGLGWDPDRYWRVRNELVSQGRLQIGRGKGGSVRLPEPPVAAESEGVEPEAAPTEYARERDLYEPVRATIESRFLEFVSVNRRTTNQSPRTLVAITAHQGSRATGEWSRPDLVLLVYREFTLLPEKRFEVWTFEVKPIGAFTVTGIYETMSHALAAHRSFALYHIGEHDPNEDQSLRLEEAAASAGVGLVYFSDPSDIETWDLRIDAPLRSADPDRVDDFLATQLPDGSKDELRRWREPRLDA